MSKAVKTVWVWLMETSEPLKHDNVISTYTKGPLYCVYCEGDMVYKYPVSRMFRAVETYGTHSDEQGKETK